MVKGNDIAERLSFVKETILKNPDSQRSRNTVKEVMDDVLNETNGIQAFSNSDVSDLIKLVVIGVGFTRAGLNSVVLEPLAGVVPDYLGIDSVFPVTQNGRRRFWMYSDFLGSASTMGGFQNPEVQELAISYGFYALRLTGLFPDGIGREDKPNGIDISYYEYTGAAAMMQAVEFLLVNDAERAVPIGDLARRFPLHRKVLNQAGALVGTPARRTVASEIIGAYQEGTKSGDYGRITENRTALRLPYQEPLDLGDIVASMN
jgi:hypothetical protein